MTAYVGDEKTGALVQGSEWDSVEQERDYWKGLALSYAAKIGAIEATMKRTWTVKTDAAGQQWIEEDTKDAMDRGTTEG